jgi:hypothetical protein
MGNASVGGGIIAKKSLKRDMSKLLITVPRKAFRMIF